MTCKDCVHYEACIEYTNLKDSEFAQSFDKSDTLCDIFKVKPRFIELPCKVGDTAYKVVGDRRRKHPLECKVVGIWLSEEGSSSIRFSHYINGVFESSFSVPFTELGKTVFLNREEAEKALKERSVK